MPYTAASYTNLGTLVGAISSQISWLLSAARGPAGLRAGDFALGVDRLSSSGSSESPKIDRCLLRAGDFNQDKQNTKKDNNIITNNNIGIPLAII